MSNLDLWKRSVSPWSDLDGLFESFLKTNLLPAWNGNMRRAMAAKVEVSETPQAYLLKFDIPGLKKEEIKIDLHDNRLTVSGERREEKREEREHKVLKLSKTSWTYHQININVIISALPLVIGH
jgi:HSP20 family protein